MQAFAEQQLASDNRLAFLHAASPVLTLNAVETALLAKEQLPHRKPRGAALAFTDDGFAMGISFLLKVLSFPSYNLEDSSSCAYACINIYLKSPSQPADSICCFFI